MDFNLSKALASINKACYELHNGKTWEDGKVYLPKKGKEADCSAELSEDHNSLTLHITKLWFSTSVTWTRL